MTPVSRGILCMIAGTTLLATQDAITKLLTDTYSPGEVMAIRGACSFPLLAMLVWREGGWKKVKAKKPGLVWLRAALGFATSLAIVTAFSLMPLADAMAVLFAAPLFVALLQGPLLGEMGWMPLSPYGIAMCQTRDFKAQAEGEGIHGRSYRHRRRSGKERVPVARVCGRPSELSLRC